MKRIGIRLFALILALLMLLCSGSFASASGPRDETMLEGTLSENGFRVSVLVERTGTRSFYFELESLSGTSLNRIDWELDLFFGEDAILGLESSRNLLLFYAANQGGLWMLQDDMAVQIQRSGNRCYGWIEVPREWEDAALDLLRNGNLALLDDSGMALAVSEDFPCTGTGGTAGQTEDGSFYGELLSVDKVGETWQVRISVETYYLYPDSYVRSLRVGDRVEFPDGSVRVVAVGKEYVDLENALYFCQANDEDDYSSSWIVCYPSGLPLLYSTGVQTYPIRPGARLIDASDGEGRVVASPHQLLDPYGSQIYYEVEAGSIVYMEHYYLP